MLQSGINLILLSADCASPKEVALDRR